MCWLQTGTLDLLVTMSDQLAKVDPQVEAVVNMFVANFKSLLDGDAETVLEGLTVNESMFAG